MIDILSEAEVVITDSEVTWFEPKHDRSVMPGFASAPENL
jgi:hypothetical protein